MIDLTNQQTIEQLLHSYRIYPTRGKGQNFLIDRKVLDEIVAAANLTKDDLVLEIGPGFGSLTTELASRVKKVLAVELDRKIIKPLKMNLKKFSNIEILEGDVLKMKNQEIFDHLGGDYKLVANLPYQITGSVLKKFLSYSPKPKEIVLMLQKEVAQRICAAPGEMSILAISVQLYGTPELVASVSKGSFYPVPEVDSAVIKITPQKLDGGGLDEAAEKKFWSLVKMGFSSRRKQLQNNLAAGLKISKDEVKNSLIKAKIDPLTRAQDLSLKDWLALTEKF